ncbi:MAG: trypsin-like peptidase domain-containing protein [Candidatus Dormibacteraeota bacterium]|nr:trypsin-like peptidase domain-containing protein [Candidatus Dormibacteraeota bacterium]MDQ6884341.1 trypsin-like peptidase domain-containing protein [Candidatus Dormibacteraeota bacterium]
MVAYQYFDNQFQPAAPAAPPASPPPKRFRRGLLIAVVALTVAGGAGSGAAAAALVDRGTPTATTATVAGTTSTVTSSTSTASSTTAVTVYKQDSPGVVTITSAVGASQATGSGIVLDTKGDILTNAHVIAGAQNLQVTFSTGQTVSATLVGSNTSADLAVIRVSVAASVLHPLTLGNSATVQVGDNVYAIGSPFGLSGSLTEGIVSNLSQPAAASASGTATNLIQTDAAINPGNSGGPLVNAQGEVIGINNSIESPVDGNVGVGFAIPINQVKQVLSSLEGGSNV